MPVISDWAIPSGLYPFLPGGCTCAADVPNQWDGHYEHALAVRCSWSTRWARRRASAPARTTRPSRRSGPSIPAWAPSAPTSPSASPRTCLPLKDLAGINDGCGDGITDASINRLDHCIPPSRQAPTAPTTSSQPGPWVVWTSSTGAPWPKRFSHVDDDGDGLTDDPADPQCSGPEDDEGT